MKRTLLLTVSAVAAMALPAKAFAFGAVVHYEGQLDDRVAYFADVRYLLNKTPPDQLGGMGLYLSGQDMQLKRGETIADTEGLEAHANTIRIRKERIAGSSSHDKTARRDMK